MGGGLKAWGGAGRLAGLGLMGLALWVAPAQAAPKCQFVKMASLPVKMEGNRPLIQGSINGQPVYFLVDTGSFGSLLFRESAEKLGLRLNTVEGVTVYGVGGGSDIWITTVDNLTLDAASVKNLKLNVVGGGAGGDGPVTTAGVLGEDLLRQFDVEMDLSHGKINLYDTKNCDDVDLIPWDDPFTVTEFPTVTRDNAHIQVLVQVNGAPVRADLDSGAYYSILTTGDAARAGVLPESPGVIEVGRAGGIGARRERTWIGTFDSFGIGEETIRHPKMRFGDMFKHSTVTFTGSHIPTQVLPAGMLLGADFLRAHHVMIAHSQGKLYVSYVGGTVFQTDQPPPATAAPPAAAQPSPSP
ncbi:retroviral-like aspartic protease family protein [Nitrospirillum sp. BR 11828]|uniref:retroviral-like aspartic protease family protein n=1 Tax=Nitrospirillum sp. BR 11828 TaxID=3104325 RepID=UPI002ACA4B49|nr:retroviral-like aspartic protease family protein [Nitrospirillum sp. BR 11828]MDZ5646528.1 retroviral-like aspartic protease family protein [Nitrospirillum sp. BR 11828]